MRAATIAIIAGACFGISSTASAIVFGPSNLGVLGYGDMDCFEPHMPYSADEYALRSLRSDVSEYFDCVDEYIEAGNKDIERIREAQDDAKDSAEAFSARLDRWIALQR